MLGAIMDAQLQQIIELQTKQNQLLERYLWRIRFSLLSLLVLTTVMCCGLGFLIYSQRHTGTSTATAFPAPPPVFPAGTTVMATPPAPTMHSYLRDRRMTWTIFCGLLAVLVVVLWVRSYDGTDRYDYVMLTACPTTSTS